MSAPGNQHRLGVRVLTLWLASHGVRAWVADPAEGLDALVELVRHVNARLLLLSVALAEQRPAVVAVARAISSIPENLRPKIIVGGNAVKMGLIEPVEGTELMSDISQLMARAAGWQRSSGGSPTQRAGHSSVSLAASLDEQPQPLFDGRTLRAAAAAAHRVPHQRAVTRTVGPHGSHPVCANLTVVCIDQ
jgi:hypothetical protein